MSRIAIKSTRIITPTEVREGVIVLSGNKISGIYPTLPEGDFEVIDVGTKTVMPGVIDPHVHINEPGRTEWEGFDSATRAALAGGVTSMIEMPLNASPVTTSVEAFEKKISAAKKNLHANCGFWGGIIPGNEKEIEPLVQKGVVGFKAFLADSGIDEFPKVAESDLRTAMPIIARSGLPLLVHCEREDVIDPVPSLNKRSYQQYLASRPRSWEDNAIALMIRLCEEYNCPVHIVHLSSGSSIEQIMKAKAKGLPLTTETAQHYLFFSSENIPEGRTEFKCAPPIRERENNEHLWAALKNGIIDFVATDHSPAPPELKETETGDFMKAWGGISSIQFALPALWTAAANRNVQITEITNWLCSAPARFSGQENKKGNIKPGMDADLVVWDPEETFIVKEQAVFHRHKGTPYMNRELRGVVYQTWLAGDKVYDAGKFLHLNKGEILYR